MSYSYNKFLRPITSSDKSIKILDNTNDIKYTIDPFAIQNVSISNNILKINLKSKRIISLHFSTINEAKLALTRIQIQIDTLIKNTPLLIDRDVQNYVNALFDKVSIIVGPTGATGAADRYGATSSTSFQFPIVGDVIDLVTQSNLAYTPAQSVIVYNDIPNLYNNNYEEGGDYFVSRIDTYDKLTGQMTLVVDFSTIITTGETYSFWYMNLSGEKGQADKYYTTSFTTLSVPQIGEVVDLEIETYLAYSSSQNVVVYSDLPNLYDNDYQIEGGYFSGQVDYYDFSTGLISIVVDDFIGEGTYSTWYMNLSGAPGIDGTTASNIGSIGPTGATGADGLQGPIGPTGADGLQGPIGPTGADGLQGPIGPTGADGDRYSTTSSDTFTIPEIGVERDFLVGTSLAYTPSQTIIVSPNDNPTDHFHAIINSYFPLTGTMSVTCTEDNGLPGQTYSNWKINLSGAVGVPGDIGPTGSDGLQGPIGPTGADGLQGATGATGPPGTGNASDIVYYGTASALTSGNIYYLSSSGQWLLASGATAGPNSYNLLGIALGTDLSSGILLKGENTNSGYTSFTTGTPLYLSVTPGQFTSTAPIASGNVVRMIGYSLESIETKKILFNPDTIWIEV